MLSGEDDTILISLNVAIKDANIVSIHPKPFSPALFLRQNYDEEKHLLSSAKRKEARKEG